MGSLLVHNVEGNALDSVQCFGEHGPTHLYSFMAGNQAALFDAVLSIVKLHRSVRYVGIVAYGN